VSCIPNGKKLLLSVLFLAGFSTVAAVFAQNGAVGPAETSVTSSAEELIDLIKKNRLYRNSLSENKIEKAVLRAIVASLDDPYAAVVDIPTQREVASSTRADTTELGLIIGEDAYSRPVIDTVLPGSPAEDAGLKGGEKVLRIGAENVSGCGSWEVMSLLSGPQTGDGKQIEMVVESARGQPRHITLRCSHYEIKTVELRIGGLRQLQRRPHRTVWKDDPKGEIAWIKVRAFLHSRTNDEWDRMVEKINNSPSVRRIVLDLRDNGGGDNSCIPLLGDFFLRGETLVTFECLSGNEPWSQHIRNTGTPKSRLICYPAAVLVNGGTASLAEIAAAALRDNRSVPLLGEKTFGKGTTQTWIKTCDRFAAHLTMGRWLSPHGYSIEGKGLVPDVTVSDNPRTVYIDEQLLSAAELLTVKAD
jgi:carboxyl-terminal processing protease